MLCFINFVSAIALVYISSYRERAYVNTTKANTHLLRTISIGTPGFTIAIFIHSLPKSTDITATVTANKHTGYIKLVTQTC